MKYILLTLLLYAACDNEEYKVPEDTIQVDTVWVDSVNVPLE